jgi:hypothetical protein
MFLFYVPHQEDNVCYCLCSLCLYFIHFYEKTTSTPPSPTYTHCAFTMCASPKRQRQCYHYQPTFSPPLFCAPFQEDAINAAIANIAQVTKAINYFIP